MPRYTLAPSTDSYQKNVLTLNQDSGNKRIVLDLSFIKLNVQKKEIDDLIHFMFQGFVIRQNKFLCLDRKPAFVHTVLTGHREMDIVVYKSQSNLLYNMVILSNRSVYNVKNFIQKCITISMYNTIIFLCIKQLQRSPCALNLSTVSILEFSSLWPFFSFCVHFFSSFFSPRRIR